MLSHASDAVLWVMGCTSCCLLAQFHGISAHLLVDMLMTFKLVIIGKAEHLCNHVVSHMSKGLTSIRRQVAYTGMAEHGRRLALNPCV